MKNVYMAPGRGIDSASAAPCGGPGFAMHHREYPLRKCGEGAAKPGCGQWFSPTVANGKYCKECRKV